MKSNDNIEYIKENIYSYYDNNGEKCIEETLFERSAIPIKQDLLENYMYCINYYKSKYELGGKE